MKQVINGVMVLVMGLLMSGCAFRFGNYSFKDSSSAVDAYFHKETTGYLETEIRSRKFYDIVNLSWGMGWLRGKSGDTVNYSTEDAFYFYPQTIEETKAHMWDTRLTARAYPFKSVPIWKSSWKFSPYGGAGYGYFNGKATHNWQGAFLGYDIYGGRHYGLNTSSFDFNGTFWSNSFGIELNKDNSKLFFVVEYRQDMDKKDGNMNFDNEQIIFGLGSSW